jgi:hypothetical protein
MLGADFADAAAIGHFNVNGNARPAVTNAAKRIGYRVRLCIVAWLLDQCITYAKAHRHPELTGQTIWEVFEAERPKLVPYAGRFDGFHAVPASVSKTCLVRFDNKSPRFFRASMTSGSFFMASSAPNISLARNGA